MSLQAKIMSLISGITDPGMRVDVASTINYLFNVYCAGHADENEVRGALYEICYDVISATHPELTEEEVRDKSEAMAEEFIRSFKLESATRRMMSRFGRRMTPPV